MSATLDQLAAQAESIGATDADLTGSPVEPDAAAITNAQAFAGAIAAAREAFCFFTKLQSPRTVLDDAKVQSLGALWGPVFDKHGFNLGELMGDYALEFAAVIGTIGIASELRSAVVAELATKAKETEAADKARTVEPASADHGEL